MFPSLHATSLLIIPFKRLRHRPEPVESVCTSSPICFRCILILSSYVRRGFTNGLLPSDFLTIVLYISFAFFIHATAPHLLLVFIERSKHLIKKKFWISSLCHFLHLSVKLASRTVVEHKTYFLLYPQRPHITPTLRNLFWIRTACSEKKIRCKIMRG